VEFNPKEPVEISKVIIDLDPRGQGLFGAGNVGKFVSIRPCDEEHKDKTFLGLYVADFNIGVSAKHDAESGVLKIEADHGNPAIFVFDLNKVVMGAESWWGVIKTEDDLKKITDADIDDLWYVKALKKLGEEAEAAAKAEEEEPCPPSSDEAEDSST
jgi:hypothetical protein